jgi:hypothetical protein
MTITRHPYPSTLPKSIKAGNYNTPVKSFVSLLLTAGTGGLMTTNNSIELLERYYPRTHVEHPAVKNVDTRSPAEHVENIRNVLTINMSAESIEFYSRPRFGLQSTNPIASLCKSPAKAISITASTGKFISIRLRLDRNNRVRMRTSRYN